MTKLQTVELLQKQLPGFYSVDQVIEMINKIEDAETSSGSFTEEQIDDLIDSLSDKVENRLNRMNGDDFVDYYSAEFEMNGNEVSVTDISVDTNNIVSEVKDVVEDVIREFFKVPETV